MSIMNVTSRPQTTFQNVPVLDVQEALQAKDAAAQPLLLKAAPGTFTDTATQAKAPSQAAKDTPADTLHKQAETQGIARAERRSIAAPLQDAAPIQASRKKDDFNWDADRAKRDPSYTGYWNAPLDMLLKRQRELESAGKKDEAKQVHDIRMKIDEVRSRGGDANDTISPATIGQLRGLVDSAHSLIGKTWSKYSDDMEKWSNFYSGAMDVATFARDAAANTVNAAADAAATAAEKVPALKPVALKAKAVAAGMNGALALIDSLGKGESVGSAAWRAALYSAATFIPGGQKLGGKLASAATKAMGRAVGDYVDKMRKDGVASALSEADFYKGFAAHFGKELTELGVSSAVKGKMGDVLKVIAGTLYDQVVSKKLTAAG